MGLDAYAYAVNYQPTKSVDFTFPKEIDAETALFFQWRKNWCIQQIMAEIYFNKEGQDFSFNCAKVVIDEDDLDYIESEIRLSDYEDEYPDDREVERERDLNFVKLAREKIQQGFTVVYDSWW